MLRRIIIVLLAIVALTAKAQLTDWRNISSHNFVMKIIHDQNYLYVGTVLPYSSALRPQEDSSASPATVMIIAPCFIA